MMKRGMYHLVLCIARLWITLVYSMGEIWILGTLGIDLEVAKTFALASTCTDKISDMSRDPFNGSHSSNASMIIKVLEYKDTNDLTAREISSSDGMLPRFLC